MKKLLSINIRSFLGIATVGIFILASYSCTPKAKGIPAADKNKTTKPRAIIHNAPNQARIDSIKAAKAKERGKQ